MEAEARLEEQKQKDREEERQRLRQQQIEERERREKEEIQKSGNSQEEKERLLREHKENMERIRDSMDQEQSRSKQALQAKLEARKKRRMDTAKAKVDKEIILEKDCEEMERLTSHADDDDEFLQAGARSSVAGGIMSGPGDKSSSGLGQFTPTGNREQDWVNMLMASPLFKQINDLADMLDKTEGGIAGGDKVLGRSEVNTSREFRGTNSIGVICFIYYPLLCLLMIFDPNSYLKMETEKCLMN